MPPQVNARVTAIHHGGIPDDWDRPAEAGAQKWAGDLPAYYREKVDRVTTAGGVNVIVRRTLWVDTAPLRRAGLLDGDEPLDTDDVITFAGPSGDEVRLPAIAVAASELAGAAPVSTTRIDLEHG